MIHLTVYTSVNIFWNGNPKIYNKNDINLRNKTTFGELFENTIQKQKFY